MITNVTVTLVNNKILNKLKIIWKEEHLPNTCYEASITLTPKPHKDSAHTHTHTGYEPISLMDNRCQNLQQNTSKPNPTICVKITQYH